MTLRKTALCLICFALLLVRGFSAEPKPQPPAGTDVVALKNGDRITGTAVKVEDGKLTFKTAYAADPIVIALDQVVKLTVSKPMVLTLAKGRTRVTALEPQGKSVKVTAEKSAPVLNAADIKSLRSPADEVVYQKTLHPDWGHGWNINAHASFALARGNANTQSIGVGSAALRTTSNDKATVNFTALYSRDNASNSATASSTDGSLRYDRNVHPRVFLFASSEFLENQLQYLDLRSLQSVGSGWHALKGKKQTLDLFGGVSWTHENYSASQTSAASSNDFPALNAGETYNAKIGKPSTFTEQANFYPSMNSTGGYQFSLAAGLTTRLVKLLSWNLNYTDNYTSFPPAGTRANDTVFTTGIGVTLVRP